MRLLKSRKKEGLNPKNKTMKNYFCIFVPGAGTCHGNKGVKPNPQFNELPSALIHHDYRICHASIALEGLLRKGASIKRIQDGQIGLAGHVWAGGTMWVPLLELYQFSWNKHYDFHRAIP